MNKDNKDKPVPYIPYNARLNVDNIPMDAPETEYEEDRDKFKKYDILEIIIK